ncbi:hypothetical protein AB0G85_38515 [Streptomyces sioyaensis]|uniref:hypothetical protein n=1 Tax=Streptomyces sioyaensis TaxID=67364 RepID=UPI0033EFAD5C
MITSIPAAEAAMATARSRSPPLKPPTAASIWACVPHSVSVTTLTWGNPAGRSFLAGPPNAARLAFVSGVSKTNPSTAASRIPR